MDAIQDLAVKIILPIFYPLAPNQRIFVLYLGSALVLALGVYLLARRRGSGQDGGHGDGLAGFLRYCFPRRVYFHESAKVDYLYFLVNKAFYGILFAPLIVSSAVVSGWMQEVLAAYAGAAVPATAGPWAIALFTLLALVVFDLGIFVAHSLQHKVPLLWEFHKVHHSAEVMTPITVYRMHPVDDLLSGALTGVLTGAVHGVSAYAYGETASELTVYHLNVGLFAFYLAGYNLRHSHIWLPYPRWLSHVLVSPAQHQIHHSSEPRHLDKNMGFVFAFWDWLAGTLYVQQGRESFDLGLYGGGHRAFDSVWKLYVLPFKNAAALIGAGGRRRQA